MNVFLLAGGLAATLIVAGAVLVSLDDERIAILTALALHYCGVAVILGFGGDPLSGVISLVIGVGSLTSLASAGALRSLSDPARRPLATSRWFDVSTTGLAVAGAIGLALSHPLYRDAPTNIAAGTLAFAGLLFTLLGGITRQICGLIFLSSAAGLMLRLTEPGLSSIDSLLLAAAQLGLVIGLSILGTRSDQPIPPARRRLRRTYYRSVGSTTPSDVIRPAPSAAEVAQ